MAKLNQKKVLISLKTLKILLQGADIALENGVGTLHNSLMDAIIDAERIIASEEA